MADTRQFDAMTPRFHSCALGARGRQDACPTQDRIVPTETKGAIWSWWIRHFVVGLFALLTLTGCQTYQQQNQAAATWKSGNAAGAARDYAARAAKADGGRDAIIWRLEEATALRATGDFPASTAAFDQADRLIDAHEERAKVSVSRETGALLLNQASLPYRGRIYDKVMLSTYRGLNYLQSGAVERARPEIIRAYQRQQEAVDENRRRIEAEEQEIERAAAGKSQEAASVEQAKQHPTVVAGFDAHYAEVRSLRAYADYVNPFTVFLDAFYFLHFAGDASDLERSRKSFERLVGLVPENKHAAADLALAEQHARGEPPGPRTYVVFETGCAPQRDQFRLDIPVFIVSDGNIPYVGAAFPRLLFDHDYVPSLTAEAGGAAVTTEVIASMDRVVGQAFNDELPSVITKTLLSTTVKTTSAYFMNRAASKEDPLFGLLSKIATSAFQASVNIADTRTWTTLPKEFQYASFPTPADGRIVLRTPHGQRHELALAPNSTSLIVVKSVGHAAPLHVHQVQLK